MKVGIIADIHADLLSLIAALELLHKKGVDQIVCAGDLVDKGPDGDAVIETIKARGIPTVRGNHDAIISRSQDWIKRNLGFHPQTKTRLLKQENLDFVDALPPYFSLTLDDVHLVVTHAIPSADDVYLYTRSPRPMFENAIYEARTVDPAVRALIIGHSHTPMIAQLDDVWVLNPGSVAGQYTEGSNTCAVLNLPDCKFEVFDLVTGMRIVPPLLQW